MRGKRGQENDATRGRTEQNKKQPKLESRPATQASAKQRRAKLGNTKQGKQATPRKVRQGQEEQNQSRPQTATLGAEPEQAERSKTKGRQPDRARQRRRPEQSGAEPLNTQCDSPAALANEPTQPSYMCAYCGLASQQRRGGGCGKRTLCCQGSTF